MKKLFLFLALALVINQTTEPISLSNARIVAGAIAVGAASGAFYLAASDQKSEIDEQGNPKKVSMFKKYRFPALMAAVAGATAGGLGYWILYGYTPEWKFSEFNRCVTSLKSDVNYAHSIQDWDGYFNRILERDGPCGAAQKYFDLVNLQSSFHSRNDYLNDLAQALKENLPTGITAKDVEDKLGAIKRPDFQLAFDAFDEIRKKVKESHPGLVCTVKLNF
jgi:hypothetical protein